MVSERKQQFIRDFFTILGEKEKYCILRNYEKLPEHVGDDIDMLVDGTDEVVDATIIPIIKSLGWDYYVKFRKDGFTPIVCMYTTERSVDTCQLDIYTRFLWRGNPFANEKAVLKSSYQYGDYLAASHGADIAITIAKELIGSERVRKKYYDKMARFANDDPDTFLQVLEPIYGNLANQLLSHTVHSEYSQIDNMAKAMKKKVRSLNPRRHFLLSVKGFWEKSRQWFHPKGKMIAFVGPDGSGKTTLIGKEDDYLERFFPHNSKIFHRNYEILPPLHTGHGLSSMKGTIKSGDTSLDENNNIVKKPKRSLISRLASWFVILYYTFEFVIGNRIAKKLVRKGTLILYDRYYYDHFVQPSTRDLIWPWRKILLGMVRKPDLIIHLVASGNHIYKRKKDLNPDEIDIQNQYMSRILTCCKKVVELNMENLDADQVAAEVFRETINRFYGFRPRKNEIE